MAQRVYPGMNHGPHEAMTHADLEKDLMMMTTKTEDDWDREKIEALQSKHRTDHPIQGVLIALPSLAPQKAIGSRINERYEDYRAKLNCPATRTAIIWKVARAVEEKRVEESKIASIFPRLELASNRGAYFVACCKGAFLSCGLSWLEEEWQDAS